MAGGLILWVVLVYFLAPVLVGAAGGEAVAVRRAKRSGPGACYGASFGLLGFVAGTALVFLCLSDLESKVSNAGLPAELLIVVFPCGPWICAAMLGAAGGLLVGPLATEAGQQVVGEEATEEKGG